MALLTIVEKPLVKEGAAQTLAVGFTDASPTQRWLPPAANRLDDGVEDPCRFLATQHETAMAGEEVCLVCAASM